ncbi:MAG: hypothetical protein J6T10_01540 [Methanobrevibacter sp.]|nr:hypothetical protein [Methanobrevibacter sp.]
METPEQIYQRQINRDISFEELKEWLSEYRLQKLIEDNQEAACGVSEKRRHSIRNKAILELECGVSDEQKNLKKNLKSL